MTATGRDPRTDPLTGLLSRYGLDERMSDIGAGDVVAVIDVDHLRRVNELAGPAAGDRALRALAACLADTCRRRDWCGRLTDGQLLLVVRASGSQPVRAVDRLRARWRTLEPPTTISVGVAVHRQGGDPAETVAQATVALGRAKSAGRDRVELHPRTGRPG